MKPASTRSLRFGKRLIGLLVLAIIAAGGVAGWVTQGQSQSASPGAELVVETSTATASATAPLHGSGSLKSLVNSVQGGSLQPVSLSPNLISTDGRLVVFTGRVILNVSSSETSLQDLKFIAAKYGGYISDSSVSPIGNNQSQAQATIRVPADKFDDALADVKALGKLVSLQTASNDVTDSYVDLNARLASSQMLLAQYQRFLNETRNVTEALAVQSNIDNIQTQIEQLKAQIQELSKQVNFATIFMTFMEAKSARAPTANVFSEDLNFAWSAALTEVRGLLFLTLGLSPFWVWIVPLTFVLVRRTRGKSARGLPPEGKTTQPVSGDSS